MQQVQQTHNLLVEIRNCEQNSIIWFTFAGAEISEFEC